MFENSKTYVSTNFIHEIIYFMITLSQYRSSFFKVFRYCKDTHLNIRFYSLVNQAFNTLKNLTNGVSSDNKMIVLTNQPFMAFLNDILSESNMDVKSENLRDVKTL